jgi:hypothetical protein
MVLFKKFLGLSQLPDNIPRDADENDSAKFFKVFCIGNCHLLPKIICRTEILMCQFFDIFQLQTFNLISITSQKNERIITL